VSHSFVEYEFVKHGTFLFALCVFIDFFKLICSALVGAPQIGLYLLPPWPGWRVQEKSEIKESPFVLVQVLNPTNFFFSVDKHPEKFEHWMEWENFPFHHSSRCQHAHQPRHQLEPTSASFRLLPIKLLQDSDSYSDVYIQKRLSKEEQKEQYLLRENEGRTRRNHIKSSNTVHDGLNFSNFVFPYVLDMLVIVTRVFIFSWKLLMHTIRFLSVSFAGRRKNQP
jgi:hypothetical protein